MVIGGGHWRSQSSRESQKCGSLYFAQRRQISTGQHTGLWLSSAPSIYHATVLSSEEFRDRLYLRYSRTPPSLPEQCDGCGNKNSVSHSLQCKLGGLVTKRHNEIKMELINLFQHAFGHSAVRDEPRITTGPTTLVAASACCPSSPLSSPPSLPTSPSNSPTCIPALRPRSSSSPPSPPPPDDRGDILVRSLWERGKHCVIDVRVTDLNSKTHLPLEPSKCLHNQERDKKRRYLKACHAQRRDFSPFVISTEGLLGKEARAILKRIASQLSIRWDRPYSVIMNFVKTRLAFAITKASHLCIRGSRVPVSRVSNSFPLWEDGTAIPFSLFGLDL